MKFLREGPRTGAKPRTSVDAGPAIRRRASTATSAAATTTAGLAGVGDRLFVVLDVERADAVERAREERALHHQVAHERDLRLRSVDRAAERVVAHQQHHRVGAAHVDAELAARLHTDRA